MSYNRCQFCPSIEYRDNLGICEECLFLLSQFWEFECILRQVKFDYELPIGIEDVESGLYDWDDRGYWEDNK